MEATEKRILNYVYKKAIKEYQKKGNKGASIMHIVTQIKKLSIITQAEVDMFFRYYNAQRKQETNPKRNRYEKPLRTLQTFEDKIC